MSQNLNSFFVPGLPIAKGSAKAFVIKKTGRAIVTQTNRDKQKPWASIIGLTAKGLYPAPVSGPIRLHLQFVMPRPKSHLKTAKNAQNQVKDSAPRYHVSKPDIDKLARCLLDALTYIVYEDDSQVVELTANKTYTVAGESPGVHITIGG